MLRRLVCRPYNLISCKIYSARSLVGWVDSVDSVDGRCGERRQLGRCGGRAKMSKQLIFNSFQAK